MGSARLIESFPEAERSRLHNTRHHHSGSCLARDYVLPVHDGPTLRFLQARADLSSDEAAKLCAKEAGAYEVGS